MEERTDMFKRPEAREERVCVVNMQGGKGVCARVYTHEGDRGLFTLH